MNDLPRNNEILDDEVNLFEVISVLNAAKIFIIFSTIIFSLIGIFYSLSLQNIYTSNAVLAVSDSKGSQTSSITSLASAAGINVGGSGGADNNQIVL